MSNRFLRNIIENTAEGDDYTAWETLMKRLGCVIGKNDNGDAAWVKSSSFSEYLVEWASDCLSEHCDRELLTCLLVDVDLDWDMYWKTIQYYSTWVVAEEEDP